jgi:hypothetical protein
MQIISPATATENGAACPNRADLTPAGANASPDGVHPHAPPVCEGRAWNMFWVGLLVLFAFAAMIAMMSLLSRAVYALRARRAA